MRRIRQAITLRRIGILAGIVFTVWMIAIAGLAISIYAYGEDNEAQPADVIIVLGSGLRRNGRPGDALYRRSVWGAYLYGESMAPAVICTGGIGSGQRRSEASACAEVLNTHGVPHEAIHLDERSRSTEENAIYAREIMRANDWETAILVTDSFHMLRANWIFNREGITHYRSPVPREWVRDYYYVRHFAREIIALHWQAFKDIFRLPYTNIG